MVALCIRYLIGGGTAAAVVIGGLYVLHEFIGVPPVVASAIAYTAGVIISFTTQKYWVFAERSTHRVPTQFASFAILAVVNIASNAFFMHLLVNVLNTWYILAQVLSAGTIAVWSFVAYRFIIFTTHETADTHPEG